VAELTTAGVSDIPRGSARPWVKPQ